MARCFRTKGLNKLFLYLFSLLSWWNPFDYASSHTYHHRYTLHPDGDRENLLPLHPNVGKTFLLQLFTVNLLTLPGRTFGKGGLLSTIWATILDASGKAGSNEIPSNEWLNVLHADHPEQHRKSMLWSRTQLVFHATLILFSIMTGLWVLPLIFHSLRFHCKLAKLFRRPATALRIAGECFGFSQEYPVHQAAAICRVSLLAYELAHRASYVCRRSLLQSQRFAFGGEGRHAPTTNAGRRVAGNARYLETATGRSQLSIRHSTSGYRKNRNAGAERMPQKVLLVISRPKDCPKDISASPSDSLNHFAAYLSCGESRVCPATRS